MKHKSLIILLYFDNTLKSKYKNMLIIIIIIFSHLTIENLQNHFNFWILNFSVWEKKKAAYRWFWVKFS